MSGLNGRSTVAVTFHCIVPKLLWEWDEESCIYLRFEGHAFGNWKCNVGKFEEKRLVSYACGDFVMFYILYYRKLVEGVVEMTCTLNFNANLITVIRGYKYVIYSPKMIYEDDCYEYLHTFAGTLYNTNPNRCLKIDQASLDSKLTNVFIVHSLQ